MGVYCDEVLTHAVYFKKIYITKLQLVMYILNSRAITKEMWKEVEIR